MLKIFLLSKTFTVNFFFFFDYNLIILKEIVILADISNHTIVDFIEKKNTSGDVKKHFVGVFSSNYVTRFITFNSMMTETGAQYPFIIMNTDRSSGVFLKRRGILFLTVLGLKVSKNFYYKTIEKL